MNTRGGPLITLVTPTFNQAGYLAQTIDSVLAQTDVDLEYIVIDDGSSDETSWVLERYSGRVRAIRQDNMGQARTLNRGWSMARGRHLGYLSSDDVLRPGALARVAAALEANPGVVCAFPDSDLIDAAARVVRRRVCRPFDLQTVVVSQECHIGPGALFRREAFEAVGGWRPELRLGPDRDFWIRIARLGSFHFVDEALALYRTHPGSASFRAASEQASREFLTVLDDFFATAEVPQPILRRRDEAYAQATMICARNALWRGEWHLGLKLYREACALHPPLRKAGSRFRLLRQGLSKPVKMIYSRLLGTAGA